MRYFKHSTYSDITIVEIPISEINMIDFALCDEPKETLESFYNRQATKPDILTNGGFFATSTGQTTFTYRDEYNDVNLNYNLLEGIGVVDKNQLVYGLLSSFGVRDFISAYPPLVRGGQIVTSAIGSEINYNARRTAIGYNSKTVYMVTVDGSGVMFGKLAQIFMELGCTYAMNLDGGGSTRLLIKGSRITDDLWSRPVDNVVAFYLNKIIYRVQSGAFSVESNAYAYRDKIRALGGIYVSAYVRIVDGMYKVQVGAFSVKSNADNLMRDLISRGYPAFIAM